MPGRNMLKFLVLGSLSLLMDGAAAELRSQQNFTSVGDGPRYSNHSIDCGRGKLVLILDVRIFLTGPSCCPHISPCFIRTNAADFQRHLAACENTSRCSWSILDPQLRCEGNITAPPFSIVYYVCSSAPAVLAMDRPGSSSGRTVAARFSSPTRQFSNSSWQCRVEASDCSTLNSVVELHIRNMQQSLSFLSTSKGGRIGSNALDCTRRPTVTPFSVTLDLVEGSHVQPAYVLLEAASGITMTCGLSRTTPSTSLCSEQQTSVVGPAVGGAVAALVVIAVVVVVIVFVWRNRTPQRIDGRESGDGKLPTSLAQRDNIASNDITRGREKEAHHMHDYLHVIPEPQAAAESAISEDQPYESLDEASGVDVDTEAPYDIISDVNTAYEPLDQTSRDDVNAAVPYQALAPATTSDYVNTA